MRLFAFFILILAFSSPSFAQNEGEAVSANSILSNVEDERIDMLVKKLHKYLPSAKLIDDAIDITSPRYTKNEKEQNQFQKTMRMLVDYEKLEIASRKHMKSTFTANELDALVEFYSNPAGMSAAAKMSDYQMKIGPEVMKAIDQTLIKYRTGEK